VISLNYGLDEDIRKDVQRFGRLTIDVGRTPLIRPGAARAAFGEAELRRVESAVEGLGASVVPVRQRWASARGGAPVARLSIAAVPADYPRTAHVGLVAGRWFRPDERGFTACVLDDSTARSLFPGLPPGSVIGREVEIGLDPPARAPVVGVLEDPMTYRVLFEAFDENRASRTLTGALLVFRNVYVPPDALPSPELSLVSVVAPNEARFPEVRRRLEALWAPTDVDVAAAEAAPITVFSRRDWMDMVGGTTQTGALLGNVVWILVVLVACIMISTLNLISIRERFDEIAIRRCEGARTRHVALQVTAEGVVVSLVGGLLGLPLGYAGAAALRRLVDFPFRFEVRYAVPAVAIAIGLGLAASVVPARRAAALDPARVLTRRLT
jgi:putative ABC transport system permease protein